MTITFLAKRKFSYILSGFFIVIAVASLFTNGLNQGVDFVGGRSYTVRFDKAINSAEVQSDLVAVLGNAEAKIFGNDNQLKITTNYKVDVEGADAWRGLQSGGPRRPFPCGCAGLVEGLGGHGGRLKVALRRRKREVGEVVGLRHQLRRGRLLRKRRRGHTSNGPKSRAMASITREAS